MASAPAKNRSIAWPCALLCLNLVDVVRPFPGRDGHAPATDPGRDQADEARHRSHLFGDIPRPAAGFKHFICRAIDQLRDAERAGFDIFPTLHRGASAELERPQTEGLHDHLQPELLGKPRVSK